MQKQTAIKYRQGDVLLARVEAIPAGKQKKRDNGVVAYGEVTGHAHRIEVEQGAEVLEIGDGLYVRVTAEGGVKIVHEEHGKIDLPKGDYRATIQREYTPEAIRNVAD